MEIGPNLQEFEKNEIEPALEKEKGYNTEIDIWLIRHGERPPNQTAPNVKLTENGIAECANFGRQLTEPKLIAGEHSPTSRTRDTVEAIISNSPAERKLRIRERVELASHSSPEFVEEIKSHVRNIFMEKKGFVPADKDLLSTKCGIDFYLKYGENRPEAQTYSPVEAAALVALRVDAAIRKSNRIKSDESWGVVLSSHDYVIASFLKEVMLRKNKNGETVRGFDSLGDLGRTINFLEGPEIIVKNDQNRQQTIKLIFRGQEYEMDTKRLGQLVEKGNRLRNEEIGRK